MALPKRPYGKDGVQLSVIGFGGIVVMEEEPAAAARAVGRAVERGVNYFDVAPTYGDAEAKLGPALEPYRKGVFLACKTAQRSAAGARAELAASLERLRTDHLDLYQLHCLQTPQDVDEVFAPGGAMEVLCEARRSGQVRYLGFSAHSEQAALEAMKRFDFDSVLFPVNFACWLKNNFGPAVVAEAARRGISRLALKALAMQKWPWPKDHPNRRHFHKCWYQPVSQRRQANLAVRFALSQDITAAVSPSHEDLLHLALDTAENLQPITPAEIAELSSLAASLDPVM
jgi:aryl-alcohol dehydrogenase-like predicted oxidoreductase